tara:strand:+ start:2816 stop:3316 length:501 start_codon:yes stop_codon:yes gene_type:complete
MAWSLSSAGLVAPASFSASGNVNTLDDVEYGTYTPILKAGSSAITCDTQAGEYCIVGRLAYVCAHWRRNQASVTSSNGNWGDLPVTTNDVGSQICGSAWGDSGNDEGHKGTWAIWADATQIAWLHGSTDTDTSRYTYIYDTNDAGNGCAHRDHLSAAISYIVKASH